MITGAPVGGAARCDPGINFNFKLIYTTEDDNVRSSSSSQSQRAAFLTEVSIPIDVVQDGKTQPQQSASWQRVSQILLDDTGILLNDTGIANSTGKNLTLA